MRSLKQCVFNTLLHSRTYPHIYFSANPFKIHEFRELMKEVKLVPSDVVLDIGCGVGLQTVLVGKRCKKIVGIDVNPNVIARAQSDQAHVLGRINCEFRCTTIEDAHFADNMFDKIMSFCVIEHIPDYMRVLRECYRTLKPGGCLVVSLDSLATIDDEALKRKHTEDQAVRHYFQPDAIRRDLDAIGFKDVSVAPLFCSAFARDLFMKGIRNQFRFRYMEAIRLSREIEKAERHAEQRERGIFLIARATKMPASPADSRLRETASLP